MSPQWARSVCFEKYYQILGLTAKQDSAQHYVLCKYFKIEF